MIPYPERKKVEFISGDCVGEFGVLLGFLVINDNKIYGLVELDSGEFVTAFYKRIKVIKSQCISKGSKNAENS